LASVKKKHGLRSSKEIKSSSIFKKNIKWIIIGAVPLLAVILFFLLRSNKPDFNGANAYSDLVKQCAFGSRVPGTEAHKKAGEYFVSVLKKYTDLVSEQKFSYKDKHDTTKVWEAYNIVASFNKEKTKRILLCAHWDSRPWADNDPDSTKHKEPVMGANDGASGVAVLLEMARLFSLQKPDVGVDIVLFDLEDIGDENAEQYPDKLNPFAIGALKFVEMNPDYAPAWGILLDMVGDKELEIPKEANSVARAGSVLDKVWAAADKFGYKEFKDVGGGGVGDDHIIFLKKFIPVADLVHSPFPEYWHTTHDTPDKCSKESLEKIGKVLVEVVYNEK
jgi:hypothetical protein